MKHAALVVVLAGMLGGAPATASYDPPVMQENQEERFYVVGHVKKPGSYRFVSKTMTVGQAIEIAGGVDERGSIGMYRLIRQVDGRRAELVVIAEDAILPNDTIQVFRKP